MLMRGAWGVVFAAGKCESLSTEGTPFCESPCHFVGRLHTIHMCHAAAYAKYHRGSNVFHV